MTWPSTIVVPEARLSSYRDVIRRVEFYREESESAAWYNVDKGTSDWRWKRTEVLVTKQGSEEYAFRAALAQAILDQVRDCTAAQVNELLVGGAYGCLKCSTEGCKGCPDGVAKPRAVWDGSVPAVERPNFVEEQLSKNGVRVRLFWQPTGTRVCLSLSPFHDSMAHYTVTTRTPLMGRYEACIKELAAAFEHDFGVVTDQRGGYRVWQRPEIGWFLKAERRREDLVEELCRMSPYEVESTELPNSKEESRCAKRRKRKAEEVVEIPEGGWCETVAGSCMDPHLEIKAACGGTRFQKINCPGPPTQPWHVPDASVAVEVCVDDEWRCLDVDLTPLLESPTATMMSVVREPNRTKLYENDGGAIPLLLVDLANGYVKDRTQGTKVPLRVQVRSRNTFTVTYRSLGNARQLGVLLVLRQLLCFLARRRGGRRARASSSGAT